MSFLTEVNQDALSIAPDQAALGPRLGFLGAMEAAFDEQRRNHSTAGLAYFFEQQDAEQAAELRRRGIKATTLYEDEQADALPSGRLFTDARYFQLAEAIANGQQGPALEILKARNAEIERIRKENPGVQIKTYTEMFDEVREASAKAEYRANLPTTFGGMVGGFIGAMGGALDPRTDPLNTATLGVGGFGRSAAGRIATEMGAQGVIEGVNQLTGVSDNRALLGRAPNNPWADVALAAVAGGAFQGVAEGAVAGARRWFRSAPADPAPPPPTAAPAQSAAGPAPARPTPGAPLATGPTQGPPQRVNLFDRADVFDRLVTEELSPLAGSRVGRARTLFDIDHVTRAMDDGARPWEVPPSTATRVLPAPGRVEPQFSPVKAPTPGETVDDIARRLDPDTFTVYDKLATRKVELRRWLKELEEPREKSALDEVADLDAEILRLRMRIGSATKRNAKKYEARIAEIQPERDALYDSIVSKDSGSMARVRREMQKVDERMRDLAPTVSAAYARARGKWDVYEQQRADIARMMADGEVRLPPTSRLMVDVAPEESPPLQGPTRAPEPYEALVQSRPDVLETLPANADAADKVSAVIAENAKIMDEAIETRRGLIARVLANYDKAKEAGGPIDEELTSFALDGVETRINLSDKHFVPNENGDGFREVTTRELLQELDEDEQVLKAVSTCSVR